MYTYINAKVADVKGTGCTPGQINVKKRIWASQYQAYQRQKRQRVDDAQLEGATICEGVGVDAAHQTVVQQQRNTTQAQVAFR